MKAIAFLLGFILIIAGLASADYEHTQIYSIPSDGISEFVVDCNNGDVEIVGIEGLKEIKVKAELFFDRFNAKETKEYLADNSEISLTAKGKSASFSSYVKQNKTSKSHGYYMSDITVTYYIQVPASLDIIVDGKLSDLSLKNLDGDIDVDDDIGRIRSQNCKQYETELGGHYIFDNYKLKKFADYDFGKDFDYYVPEVSALPAIPAIPEIPAIPALPSMPAILDLRELRNLKDIGIYKEWDESYSSNYIDWDEIQDELEAAQEELKEAQRELHEEQLDMYKELKNLEYDNYSRKRE